MKRIILLCWVVVVPGCAGGDVEPGAGQPLPDSVHSGLSSQQHAFWDNLAALCGQAFAGTVVESIPPDTLFAGRRLVMHVRECGEDAIRIPFHVGEDRSRTWVVTRTAEGLRLKHDHRHQDGTPDALTQYGGDTAGPGTSARQSFRADSATAAMLPVAATNVWTLELEPGEAFAYALRREGAERRFRAEFDLRRPVPPPPPPWGGGAP